MKGDTLRAIRKRLGLTVMEMGKAFGWQGTAKTMREQLNRYETGKREIPPAISRLAIMFDRFKVPGDFLNGAPPSDP